MNGDAYELTKSNVIEYTLSVKKDLLGASLILKQIRFDYDGKEHYPVVIAEDEHGWLMEEGKDFEVVYLRNGKTTKDFINPGVITVQIQQTDSTDTIYCGYPGEAVQETYEIVCTEHKAKDGTEQILEAADCIHTGTAQYECEYCGETYTEELPATGVHTPGTWTTTKAATCTAAGTKVQKCTVSGCGATVNTATIPATGHKGGTATCTAKAKCSVCGTAYGSLAAHKSDNTWKTVTQATAVSTGTETQNCSVCGTATATRTVDKLPGVLELPGNLKTLSIKKGKTANCTITMAMGDTLVSCKSSNSKILKVVSYKANGTISLKGVKTGKVTLTMKLASEKTRTYTVSVVSGTVKTTSISVESTSITLAKGKSQSLKATVAPFTSTQAVSYSTSNKKIVKVSKNKITAVAPGTAKITVKSGTKKVVCTIKVTK